MTTWNGSAALAGGVALAGVGVLNEPAVAAIAGSIALDQVYLVTTAMFSYPTNNANGPRQKEWSDLPLNALGDFLNTPDAVNIAIQVAGTFGSGGYVNIEGSLDGTDIVTLKDPSGNALRITSAGLYAVGTIPNQLRPNVPAGDNTTSLTVTAIMRPMV